MSYDSAKYQYPSDSKGGAVFSGWVTTNTPNTHLAPYLSPYGKNFRLDGASVINRPWHQFFVTVDWTDYPRWIFSYLRASAANDRLIARQNVDSTHKLVSITEAWVKTNVLTNSNITSDARMISVNIGDDLYLMNGTDFGRLNWTTYTSIASTKSHTATTISFSSTTIISDSAGLFLARWYAPQQSITITWSASNNATFTILTVTATTITVASGITTESAWASVTMVTNAAKPSFWVFFAGCLWIGWFTWVGFTNQVWKSPTNTPVGFTAAGSDVFTFVENVTWMISNTQAIIVTSKNVVNVADLGSQVETAGVITFSFRTLQANEGSTNHASLVSEWADFYYISPSNSINKIVRGNNIYWFEVISLSQRKYKGINEITSLFTLNQTEVHSQSFPQQNLIKWFFQTIGSTTTDYCIVYDVIKDQFIIDTNKYFYDECFFHGYIYAVSNITSTVFIDEIGADDAWSGISFEYWTKAFDEWEFTLKKGYWESRTDVSISELAVLTQEIFTNSEVSPTGDYQGQLVDTLTVDDSSINIPSGGIGSEAIWTFAIGEEGYSPFYLYPLTLLRTKGNLNVRGYSIQFRFTNDKVGSSVKLRRLGYKVDVLPSITTNLTRPQVTYLTTEDSRILETEDSDLIII